MNKLDVNDSLVIVIDVQEKLVEMLRDNCVAEKVMKLVQAANIMSVPVVLTEQYPKGLGATIDSVKAALPKDIAYFEKTTFSALDTEGVREKIMSYGRKQVILCGIETHICVHQTCADLLAKGYDVYVVKDACASRNKYEFEQGIDIMQQNGAKITCLEVALFEWLRSSKHPNFKAVQALIK